MISPDQDDCHDYDSCLISKQCLNFHQFRKKSQLECCIQTLTKERGYCLPKRKEDGGEAGWMEVELGEFFTPTTSSKAMC